MATSDYSDGNFDDRVKRLELLVSALIASGLNVDPEILDRTYFELLRMYPEDKGRPDPFMRLLRQYSFQGFDRFGIQRQLDHLTQRFADILEENQNYRRELEKYQEQVRENQLEISEASQDLHAFLSMSALGVPQENIRLHRFIPIRVYASKSNREIENRIKKAVLRFVDAFGFTIADDLPEQRGSWLKPWFIKSKDALTQPEVTDRLRKIEKAIEMKGLELPQAEVDKTKASAVKELMESVKDLPQAAIHVGSILIVKTTNQNGPLAQIKSLNSNEIIMLENNQALLASPETVLQKLSDLCRQEANHKRRRDEIKLKDFTMPDRPDVPMLSDNRAKKDDEENDA